MVELICYKNSERIITMDNPNYTTEHRKWQHLLNEERYDIQVRLKDGWSIYKIAKHLGRAYNTIKDEVERGTVTLYNGKVKRYKADQGKSVYLENREHSTRRYRGFETAPFLEFVRTPVSSSHQNYYATKSLTFWGHITTDNDVSRVAFLLIPLEDVVRKLSLFLIIPKSNPPIVGACCVMFFVTPRVKPAVTHFHTHFRHVREHFIVAG